MGFDAPEMRTQNVEEKQKAEEAKEFLKTLLPKGIFRLQIHGLDKYGRLLIDPSYKGNKISDVYPWRKTLSVIIRFTTIVYSDMIC